MDASVPQSFVFMITLYGGVLVGVAYDIYRGVRRAIKMGRWVTAILDTLFILTLGLIVMAVMFTANQGELRLYTFIGFVLGFALYMAGLSPFITYLAKKFKNWLQNRKRKE